MGMVFKKLKSYPNLVLFVLFMSICFGLGYSVMNRFNPADMLHLDDTIFYINIVENGLGEFIYDASSRSTRIIVPYLAHIVYILVPQLGSWNMALFSMMFVGSIFTSLNALLIFNLTIRIIYNRSVAIVASLLFLSNFIVPNFYLIGYIDAGYAFSFTCLFYLLLTNKYYLIPILAIIACATKETFLPIGSCIIVSWLIYEYVKENRFNIANFSLGFVSIFLSLLTVIYLKSLTLESLTMPWEYMSNMKNINYHSNFFDHIINRTVRFSYAIGMLVLLAIPFAKKLPNKLFFSTCIGCLVTIFLGIWIGIGGVGFARGVFSVASFSLCFSASYFLCYLIGITNKSIDGTRSRT